MKRWTLSEIWARTPRIALASFLIYFLTIFIAIPCRADDASAKAARQLAQKIAAQIDHKKKMLVEVVDLTGELRAAELDDTKKVIENELRARGLHIVADTSFDAKVRISLVTDNSERLWIADYDNDGTHAVLMEPFERPSFDAKPWASRTHMDLELVFSGNSPILDFVCTNFEPDKECGKVLVLYTDSIVLMDAEQKFPRISVTHDGTWPRALLGRITISGPGFRARIENVECSGDVAHMEAAKCAPTTNPWIFSGPEEGTFAFLAPSGNWFRWPSGSAEARGNRPPFYTLAGLEAGGQRAWISTELAGETRLVDGKSGNTLGTTSAWGSELATVETDCGTGWQILSTGRRDRTEADSVTVYEWVGTEFRALSDALELDGPVVAMWPGENDGTARAVVHNLKTGNYEAYLLKVGCSQ